MYEEFEKFHFVPVRPSTVLLLIFRHGCGLDDVTCPRTLKRHSINTVTGPAAVEEQLGLLIKRKPSVFHLLWNRAVPNQLEL